jgi:hypothetical protein
MRSRYLVVLFVALLLSACSKGGSGHGTGGISFSLKMPPKEASMPQYKAAFFPCAEYPNSTIEAQLHNNQEALMATGGPWPCDAGEGSISNIEEGNNYLISISLKDAQGNVIFRGNKGGLQVIAGEITDAGTIDLISTYEPPVEVNRPPVLTAPTSINFDTFFTSLLSFQVSATDPDTGDTLTFYAADLPQGVDGTYLSGVSFDPTTQTFTWAAASAPIGEYKVLFVVTDNGTPKMSDYAWVSIQRYQTTLNAATDYGPHYPVLSPIGPKQITLGEQVNFTVAASDPDDNPLNYSSNTINAKQPPTNYIFDSTGTQSFSWSSNTPGNYWLRFTATDAIDHLSDSEDVVFTVGDVNRPPTLTPIGRRVVRNNQTITFIVTGTDPENNTLTYNATASLDYLWPTGATFDTSTQTFTWTPNLTSPPETPKIRFSVTDNGSPSESDYEDVAITVLP